MNEWVSSGIQALLFIAAVVGAWWHLKSKVALLEATQKNIAEDVKEIKDTVNHEGFVKKSDLMTLLNEANQTHERHEREIGELRRDIRDLDKAKLAVADYRKERRRGS